jgi:hypothetical protein
MGRWTWFQRVGLAAVGRRRAPAPRQRPWAPARGAEMKRRAERQRTEATCGFAAGAASAVSVCGLPDRRRCLASARGVPGSLLGRARSLGLPARARRRLRGLPRDRLPGPRRRAVAEARGDRGAPGLPPAGRPQRLLPRRACLRCATGCGFGPCPATSPSVRAAPPVQPFGGRYSHPPPWPQQPR